MMQADKLKGKIAPDGKLIITELTNLNLGDVEVIILQSATTKNTSFNKERIEKRPSKVKTFQQWFAKTKPTLSEFEPDKAKWEYLQEKYNL
ncbi:MAG: hypothetical protein QNJ72_38905 [Pleurocapsa sp. MO_226.B13]|nr:hypothetical protein [Pleurocapsa sp. MO_226.B13]